MNTDTINKPETEMIKRCYGLALLFMFFASPAIAGEADVLQVKVSESGDRTYNFAVTVEHPDTGWEHYADRWEILDQDGVIMETRILYHPHVNEQPFTRSLSGIEIPAGNKKVTVRAHDSVHEYGGRVVTADLP
ncbi:MAG: hypothetical protein V2I35_13680 [Desulfocapsaceae bacterium]|jgi:hypothetical protein|nr:hypothetical protein [Desulfocapsaceae bacterium]